MDKKGQIGFGNAPSVVLALVLIGLVVAAGVISLAAFKSTSSNAVANTTIDSSITGMSNLSAQLPTVGQMVGIALILTVILGVFAFGMAKKGEL